MLVVDWGTLKVNNVALKNRALGGEEKEKRSTIAKKFKALFTSPV